MLVAAFHKVFLKNRNCFALVFLISNCTQLIGNAKILLKGGPLRAFFLPKIWRYPFLLVILSIINISTSFFVWIEHFIFPIG